MRVETLRLRGSEKLSLVGDARGEAQGPSVLFLHGGGQTRHSWGGTAELLAREGRYTLTLDLRGHGDSDWSPTGNYEIDHFVADLYEVLATFRRPPVVVGASLGGLAALLGIGEAHDPHVSGIVLVDISTRIEPAGAERISAFMRARPEGFGSLEEVAEAVASYARHRKRAPNPKGLEKNVRLGPDGRYRWHWDPKFMDGKGGPKEIQNETRLRSAASRLGVPALLVRGRESDVVSPEGARDFLKAAPQAEFIDVSGAGHMVAGDRNDAFTRAVKQFLDRTSPPR